MAQWKKS